MHNTFCNRYFFVYTLSGPNEYLMCMFIPSKPQQYKMAKYCEETFGELLLRQPLENFPVNTL